jgi:ABC-type molybdenum transport system ATPase subunit/photorepair protein PhrA
MTGKVVYDQVLTAGDIELGEISIGDDVKVKVRTPSDAESARIRALTYTPHDNENSPSILTFTNIKVVTKTANKKILINDVSGSITGGFWAIMGSSGGGKTTLLSTWLFAWIPTTWTSVETFA